jgi:cytochrome c oxidase subunit 2
VDTLKHPGSFQVIARGADGTAVAEHAAGTRVSQLGTLFFPENNATYGKAVDDLFYLILWITGIAFVLTEGFLLYIILSFWAKPGRKALYTHGNHKLELVWTVIPAVILVTLAILQSGMWREMKVDQPRPGEPNVVPVQVAAQTYNWFFRYPGKDGQFGTVDDVTSAVLKVPVGRKVALTIRSRDTIHSFFLPNFRLKQDAVPGLAVPAWFEAMRTGVYTVMCAELCGAQHFTMAADMEVLEADAFDAWVQERSEAGKEERDGMDRPDWMGDMWWWWDSVPTATGFVGDRPSR